MALALSWKLLVSGLSDPDGKELFEKVDACGLANNQTETSKIQMDIACHVLHNFLRAKHHCYPQQAYHENTISIFIPSLYIMSLSQILCCQGYSISLACFLRFYFRLYLF